MKAALDPEGPVKVNAPFPLLGLGEEDNKT